MISHIILVHSVSLLFSAPKTHVNTDSIRAIFADGQRAHDISAEMKDGRTINLLHDGGGGLWLGDVSNNHKWFMTKNPNWSPKKKNCEILICNASTMECKCEDVVADSGYSFSRFMDDGTDRFQLIGDKRVNGKFPKKILPLDSFETRFNVEVNKRTKK